jgi:glycosyltransferase involved in cell wall biosynthesis
MRPFVSIIVPFLNAEKNLLDCIGSLVKQDYPRDRYEIILVDNGSTDQGAALAANYQNELRLLTEPEPGSYKARNKGLQEAQGQIVAFTDSDAVPHKEWLKELIKPFDAQEVFAVAGRTLPYQAETPLEIRYEMLLSAEHLLALDPPLAPTVNVAFHKSLFENYGYFDEAVRSGGDTDFSWRIQSKGHRIVYVPQAVVFHKNVRTRRLLFKKIFIQSFYAQYVRKKNLSFLENSGRFRRVDVDFYLKYAGGLLRSLLNPEEISFKVVFLTAKLLGSICGSIRYRFFYI